MFVNLRYYVAKPLLMRGCFAGAEGLRRIVRLFSRVKTGRYNQWHNVNLVVFILSDIFLL